MPVENPVFFFFFIFLKNISGVFHYRRFFPWEYLVKYRFWKKSDILMVSVYGDTRSWYLLYNAFFHEVILELCVHNCVLPVDLGWPRTTLESSWFLLRFRFSLKSGAKMVISIFSKMMRMHFCQTAIVVTIRLAIGEAILVTPPALPVNQRPQNRKNPFRCGHCIVDDL